MVERGHHRGRRSGPNPGRDPPWPLLLLIAFAACCRAAGIPVASEVRHPRGSPLLRPRAALLQVTSSVRRSRRCRPAGLLQVTRKSAWIPVVTVGDRQRDFTRASVATIGRTGSARVGPAGRGPRRLPSMWAEGGGCRVRDNAVGGFGDARGPRRGGWGGMEGG
ncbi:unnamed protein product, partial [Discosporangium mesarthrocarpum]